MWKLNNDSTQNRTEQQRGEGKRLSTVIMFKKMLRVLLPVVVCRSSIDRNEVEKKEKHHRHRVELLLVKSRSRSRSRPTNCNSFYESYYSEELLVVVAAFSKLCVLWVLRRGEHNLEYIIYAQICALFLSSPRLRLYFFILFFCWCCSSLCTSTQSNAEESSTKWNSNSMAHREK